VVGDSIYLGVSSRTHYHNIFDNLLLCYTQNKKDMVVARIYYTMLN
jgi:hypothetical protein